MKSNCRSSPDSLPKKAEAAARTAHEKLQQARLTKEQRRARADSLERELKQAESQEKEAKTLATDVQAALKKAGFKAEDDAPALVRSIQRDLQTLAAASIARMPLPRFWYFPHGKKAVVVMTGDDHGNGGTSGRFDQRRLVHRGRL